MQFSRHGIPAIVISDSGPQYDSAEFTKFVKDWHFQHITSSPRNPQSNGKGESAVQICENIMKKAALRKFDPYLALLDYRNTPTEMGSSPAQRLFSRRTRNLLPLTPRLLEQATVPLMDVQQKLIASRQKQAYYYNLKGKALPEQQPGQTVRMTKPNENSWTEAVCKKMIGPRSSTVVSGNRTYRRSRRQLCIRLVPPTASLLASSEKPRDTNKEQQPIQCATPQGNSGEATPGPANPKTTAVPMASSPTVTRSSRTVRPLVRFQDYTSLELCEQSCWRHFCF